MYFTDQRINQLRKETLGTTKKVHFNNAGAALMPKVVVDQIKHHLNLEESIGGYEAAKANEAVLLSFYEAVAQLIGAQSHQIAFATSATDAYSRALSSIPFQKGDIILTSNDDYVSNQIAFLQLQKTDGVIVERVANDSNGLLNLNQFYELAERKKPKLIALTHIPTNAGLIQPVYEVGKYCREKDILYLVDGCQSAGQSVLNMETMGCDFFSATMRKFLRGPRGTGFLYVSDKVLELGFCPKFVDLHSATWTNANEFVLSETARRFELWERPIAFVAGAAAACKYANNVGHQGIEQRVQFLAGLLMNELGNVPGIKPIKYGDPIGGIVTFCPEKEGWQPEILKGELDRYHINTSIVYKSSALIDFSEKNLDWAIRMSPHYYNTENEIEFVTNKLRRIVSKRN